MIFTWRLLTEEPSTSAWVMWLDDDSSGADHTFRWGVSDVTENTVTVTDPKPLLPLDNAFVYGVKIDGLSAKSTYVCEIEGESDTIQQQFRTLTTEPLTDGLTIAQISDIHPYRGSGFFGDVDPNGIAYQDIASQDPDLLLSNGDFPSTRIDCISGTAASNILAYFEQYHVLLNEHQIVPLVIGLGNHEWGYFYDPFTMDPEPGVGCSDGIAYYYETLFPNAVELSPGYTFGSYQYFPDKDAGQDYNYQIMIGDEVQILALESTTMKPWDTSSRAADLISDEARLIIPLHHYGLWTTRDNATMQPLSFAVRSYLLPVFDSYPTPFMFKGHDHGRGITFPIMYSETQPDGVEGEDWEALDGGGFATFAGENNGGIVEYASGWATNRGGSADVVWPYDQLSGSDYEQHYIIRIGNPSVTVEERSFNTLQNTDTFELAMQITAGNIARVTTNIENTGNAEGTQDITLMRNGDIVDEQSDLFVLESETEQVVLGWATTQADVGSHTLTVASEDDTDTFDVQVAEATVTRTGTVTRDGSAVQGADVVFITRADLLANATAQTTTDASGEYSAEIPTGEDMVGIALEGDDGDSTPFTEGA